MNKLMKFINTKILLISLLITAYIAFLVVYDLFVFKRTSVEMLPTYIAVLVGIPFVGFGTQFILWIQLKLNHIGFLKFGIIFFMIGSIFMSIIMAIEYFTVGFVIHAFIMPVIFLSVVVFSRHVYK